VERPATEKRTRERRAAFYRGASRSFAAKASRAPWPPSAPTSPSRPPRADSLESLASLPPLRGAFGEATPRGANAGRIILSSVALRRDGNNIVRVAIVKTGEDGRDGELARGPAGGDGAVRRRLPPEGEAWITRATRAAPPRTLWIRKLLGGAARRALKRPLTRGDVKGSRAGEARGLVTTKERGRRLRARGRD
jgi:hypothetical protein